MSRNRAHCIGSVGSQMHSHSARACVRAFATFPGMEERLLRRCIAIASEARAHGNHPFGALIADEQGGVLLEAENSVITGKDVTAHAELNAVRAASRSLTPEVLQRATLYTSTEPCPMCAGAIFWAGIGRVVYALSEDGLYEQTGETPWMLKVPCRDVFAKGARQVSVAGPMLEAEARKPHEGFWREHK